MPVTLWLWYALAWRKSSSYCCFSFIKRLTWLSGNRGTCMQSTKAPSKTWQCHNWPWASVCFNNVLKSCLILQGIYFKWRHVLCNRELVRFNLTKSEIDYLGFARSSSVEIKQLCSNSFQKLWQSLLNIQPLMLIVWMTQTYCFL